MTIAILDPFSGIAGDMTLGALIDCGLDPAWLEALPHRLGLDGVGVRITSVRRGDLACRKVDFDIPPQPHGRHLKEIRTIVARAGMPDAVERRALAVFETLAAAEGEIHGMSPERVHLHEVGAVDAILDVVGSVWGLAVLGVDRVYCRPLSLGDGFVTAAHGVLPVPAPATLKLLAGQVVRHGPEGAGELVTPTGAALVQVLSEGPPPAYRPVRTGFGAGTKDFAGRANALRITIGEPVTAAGMDQETIEELALLTADIDDMSGEDLARTLDQLRANDRARDVVAIPVYMKKGRIGTRVEVLCSVSDVTAMEDLLFSLSSTIGIRHAVVLRRALGRELVTVDVAGHAVSVKRSRHAGGVRVKAEADDVTRVAAETGQAAEVIVARAVVLAAAAAGKAAGGPGVDPQLHPTAEPD